MASVKLEHVTKILSSGVAAVKDISLEAADGDIVIITGPSGSGKSALIRILAGLDELTSGNIYMNDRLVNDIPARERSVAMVFKHHTLYPDLTVYENMAVGLRMIEKTEAEIRDIIFKYVDIFQIRPLLDLIPDELTEMQKHKVVIARAMVKEPALLLLDDPAFQYTREQVYEIKELVKACQEKHKMVVFFMTGDNKLAMEVGKKVILFYNGLVQQMGTPAEILQNPANQFVKDFVL